MKCTLCGRKLKTLDKEKMTVCANCEDKHEVCEECGDWFIHYGSDSQLCYDCILSEGDDNDDA